MIYVAFNQFQSIVITFWESISWLLYEISTAIFVLFLTACLSDFFYRLHTCPSDNKESISRGECRRRKCCIVSWYCLELTSRAQLAAEEWSHSHQQYAIQAKVTEGNSYWIYFIVIIIFSILKIAVSTILL